MTMSGEPAPEAIKREAIIAIVRGDYTLAELGEALLAAN
jgi:hypothetical protein